MFAPSTVERVTRLQGMIVSRTEKSGGNCHDEPLALGTHNWPSSLPNPEKDDLLYS